MNTGRGDDTDKVPKTCKEVRTKNASGRGFIVKHTFLKKWDIIPKFASAHELVFVFKETPASPGANLDEDGILLAKILLLFFPRRTLAKVKSLLPDS